MSHIVSFRIDGLAGRKESLELELNRNTNILFGLNGSGKTSILKILHSAMSNETENLHNVPFTAADVSIYSLHWKKVFTRSIKKPKQLRANSRVSRRVVHREMLVGDEVILLDEPSSYADLEWSCSPSIPKKAASTRFVHEYLPTTRLHVSDEPYFPHLEALTI